MEAYLDDMKYPRFFSSVSYRFLRFLSLLFMTIGQFASIFRTVGEMYAKIGLQSLYTDNKMMFDVMIVIGQLSLPLLLMSVFSEMLRNSEHIIRLLIIYISLAFVIGYTYHVIFPTVVEFALTSGAEALPTASAQLIPKILNVDFIESISSILPASVSAYKDLAEALLSLIPQDFITSLCENGFIQDLLKAALSPDRIDYHSYAMQLSSAMMLDSANINVFTDIALCTTIYFFAVYTPKKLKGTKLMIFRLFSVFPMLYALISFIVAGLARHEYISLTAGQISFLTCRKPASFLVFGAIVFFMKYEHAYALEHNVPEEAMESFMVSKRADMHFSVNMSVMLALISLLEFGLSYIPEMHYWGFGYYKWMFLGIPFALMFSFKKKPKHKWVDMYVPLYLIAHYTLIFLMYAGAFIIFLEDMTGIPIETWFT